MRSQHRWIRFLVPCFCALLFTLQAFGQASTQRERLFDDPVLERENEENRAIVRGELQRTHPALVPEFDALHIATQANNDTEAMAIAERAIATAPTSDAPWRWRCFARMRTGDVVAARRDCRAAIERNPSWNNFLAMSLALAAGTEGDGPTASELHEARSMIDRALELHSNGLDVQVARCHVAARSVLSSNEGQTMLDSCSYELERRLPNALLTHRFAFLSAATHGDVARCRQAIDRLRALNEAPATIRQLEAALHPRVPWQRRVFDALKVLYASWIGGWILLFALGVLLSHVTLQTLTTEDTPSGTERVLRGVYRAVLWVCCVYYFLSIPMMALAVVLIILVGALLILSMGVIPLKLVFLFGVMAVGSLLALVNSLSIRGKEVPPGEALSLREHPALAEVLERISRAVNTRNVDKVYLVPNAELAVFERGGILQQLRGTSERCLVVGIALLEALTVAEFESILAHEFGHFRNEDTAGGHLALAVRRSLLNTLLSLVATGTGFMSPVWWFAAGFEKVFLRISLGASRLQEVLADRVAAKLRGSETFSSALQTTIRQSLRFEFSADATIKHCMTNRAQFYNLYEQNRAAVIDETQLAEEFTKEYQREASAYDSHPSPAERVKHCMALGFSSQFAPDQRPAWALFTNQTHIEERMTDEVRTNIARRTGKLLLKNFDPPTDLPEAFR